MRTEKVTREKVVSFIGEMGDGVKCKVIQMMDDN